jgi:hypothetical protein
MRSPIGSPQPNYMVPVRVSQQLRSVAAITVGRRLRVAIGHGSMGQQGHAYGSATESARCQCSRFGPMDHDLALADQPCAVPLDIGIQVVDRRDRHGAHCSLDRQVVNQAAGHSRGSSAVDPCGALTVDMHGGLVCPESMAYRRQLRASPKFVGGHGIAAVVDDKIDILGEQRHLSGSITPIRAVCVRIDQFTNRLPVSHLRQQKTGVIGTATRCSNQRSVLSTPADAHQRSSREHGDQSILGTVWGHHLMR